MGASPPPRLGVLHAPFGAAGLRDIYTAARGLCQVVLLFRAEIAAAHPDIVATARTLFEVVVVDERDALPTIAGLGLSGMTTFHDSELDLVDAALLKLGLPGAPQFPGPWDKLVQRRRFAALGVSAVRAAQVDSATDFAAAVDTVGLPGVLKPRRAAKGAGIAFVGDVGDAAHQLTHRRAWAGMLYETHIPAGRHPSGVPWLADFISVETVTHGRQHHHVAVFDKTPMAIVARVGADGADSVNTTGDLLPSRLPPDAMAEALRCVTAALDALRVTSRVTHTELRVTESGADIIEVNGRAGGHMSPILRLLDGPDLILSALRLALGHDPRVQTATRPGYAAGLFMTFPERSGRVVSKVSAAELRALPGVVGVDEVARCGDPRADTGFRVATVTIRSPDAAAFDRDAQAVMHGIARLFEADGLTRDPWLLRVREPAT